MFLCREFSSQENTWNERGWYKYIGGILKAKRYLKKLALALATSFQTSVKMSASPVERGFIVPRKNPDCCAGSGLLLVSVEEICTGSWNVRWWEIHRLWSTGLREGYVGTKSAVCFHASLFFFITVSRPACFIWGHYWKEVCKSKEAKLKPLVSPHLLPANGSWRTAFSLSSCHQAHMLVTGGSGKTCIFQAELASCRAGLCSSHFCSCFVFVTPIGLLQPSTSLPFTMHVRHTFCKSLQAM